MTKGEVKTTEMDASTILRVDLLGLWNNRVATLNRFHYEITEVGTPEKPLITWLRTWRDKMFESDTSIVTATSSQQVYNLVRVSEVDRATYNVTMTVEEQIEPLFGTGRDAGDSLPAFVCVTIRLARPDTTWRYGYKRFTGIPDSQVEAGRLTGDAMNKWDLVATRLEGTWTPEGPGEPRPGQWAARLCLVRATLNGDPVRPVRTVPTPFLLVSNRPGSQVSRKE